eukprot:scaffold907_cov144-Skeletonema_menzelii.AAC.13
MARFTYRAALIAVLLQSAAAFAPVKLSVSSPASTALNVASVESATSFSLDEYLQSKIGPIEEALAASVESRIPQTAKICESMAYSLMAGGKRIRPVLCIAACEMFGGSQETAMPTAVALEMIHTMSLIHDDLPSMDNDDMRRGKPTNHVIYGEDVAILAGDSLLSTSFEHVARHTKGVDAEKVVDVIARLGKSVGAEGLAGGQVAVASGAVLGGATPEEVAACEQFAMDIGLAFQVADDILDVTASTEDLGKTAGKDEATDKTTYVKLMGLEESKKYARQLIDEAKECLAPFGDRAAPLLAIADFIVDRKN